ncbi:CoA transferase [Pseudonocardia ailaonensis]|uniref:CoA transferase n=1 Tax=Pseudonocardia ailaonensis TaxID=367279 RepID=A0ABN2NJX2_9PSEU
MQEVFGGVRVVELAEWAMVPSAAAVLADFGADVVKVEPVARGDSMRGLAQGGGSPTVDGVALLVEQANRGKRSIGIDLRTERGRQVLRELVAGADVVMTSYLRDTQEALGVTPEELRALNPALVYVRATAAGPRGDATRRGYDSTVYWARGGIGFCLTPPGAADIPRSRPGFGDRAAAMNLAFGVAGALYRRAMTGRGGLVDVSLLGTAVWQLANDISYTRGTGVENSRRAAVPNPLSYCYTTADDRGIALGMLQSDRFWPELCRALDRPELLADPRFVDAAARTVHSAECVAALAEAFRARPLAQWRERLAACSGPWEVVQSVHEVLVDEQVVANRYVRGVVGRAEAVLVASAPVEFDEDVDYELRAAPEHGADTEAVLLELGYDWEAILALKDAGAVL